MERPFHDELLKFNTDLLKMASLTEAAIHRSIVALTTQDKELAESVIRDDAEIDEMENNNEELAITLLAMYQPMARDLRFITTGMKINSELERIADLATNICKQVLTIVDEPLVKPLIDLPVLADNAKHMVRVSIDAFVTRDGRLAQSVILYEKDANRLRNKIVDELINDYMVKDGSTAPRAVPLMIIARHLERICDHAVMISEDVIYMVRAKVVKHHLSSMQEILSSEVDE